MCSQANIVKLQLYNWFRNGKFSVLNAKKWYFDTEQNSTSKSRINLYLDELKKIILRGRCPPNCSFRRGLRPQAADAFGLSGITGQRFGIRFAKISPQLTTDVEYKLSISQKLKITQNSKIHFRTLRFFWDALFRVYRHS